jgi:hypothetical protein
LPDLIVRLLRRSREVEDWCLAKRGIDVGYRPVLEMLLSDPEGRVSGEVW